MPELLMKDLWFCVQFGVPLNPRVRRNTEEGNKITLSFRSIANSIRIFSEIYIAQ